MRNNFILLLMWGVLLFPMQMEAKHRDCLCVYLDSGEKLIFFIEEEPIIFLNEGHFDIDIHSLSLSEIKKYTFEDSQNLSSDVFDIVANKAIICRNGIIFIENSSKKNSLHIYTPLGMEILYSPIINSDGKMIIDLNQLPDGIYLLNFGDETLKIKI